MNKEKISENLKRVKHVEAMSRIIDESLNEADLYCGSEENKSRWVARCLYEQNYGDTLQAKSDILQGIYDYGNMMFVDAETQDEENKKKNVTRGNAIMIVAKLFADMNGVKIETSKNIVE